MSLNIMAAVIAAVVAYIFTPVVRHMAETRGIVAHPGGRRVHARPTPLLGGVAMYIGFIVAIAAALALTPWMRKLGLGGVDLTRQATGILVGGTLVAFVGILDDKYELPGWVQAFTLLGGGLILGLFDVRIVYITSPITVYLGYFSIPVTMLWVLMVTKAVDCMDGLDGLAAGISAVAACTLMLMAARYAGASPIMQIAGVMSAALFGAAIGFLRYNYPPAKIFMGTVGAQFLGFVLAGISVLGAFKIPTMVAVAIPILILAVPLFDTTFVVLRRALTGRKVSEADTTHLHHRLVRMGLSHRQTVWIIYGLTILFCAIAYALFYHLKH